MDQLFFILGSIFGGLAVVFGAFGTHGLRSRVHPKRLENFETGVRYQMYHALAMIATAFAMRLFPESPYFAIAGWSFLGGILIFSGSLYMLSMSGRREMGAVAPIGGLAFIAGWALLIAGVLV